MSFREQYAKLLIEEIEAHFTEEQGLYGLAVEPGTMTLRGLHTYGGYTSCQLHYDNLEGQTVSLHASFPGGPGDFLANRLIQEGL